VAAHDPVVKAIMRDSISIVLASCAWPLSVRLTFRIAIGNRVYWTKRRVKLKKGETVITDGKMTARTRCANRVEDVPQKAISAEEPAAAKFDEPGPPAGTAVAGPPPPFESALMNRPGVPSLGPSGPVSTFEPIGNGPWTPIAPPHFLEFAA